MKDIEPAVMENILQFLYLGEVEVPNEDVEAIIKISKELGVVGLSMIKTKEETEDGHSSRLAKRKIDSIHNLQNTKKEKIDFEELCENKNSVDSYTEEINDTENCENEEAEDDEDVEEDEESEEDDETEDEVQENGENQGDEEESYLLPDQMKVPKQSLFQRRIEREKEEKKENILLTGSIAKNCQKDRGQKKGNTFLHYWRLHICQK